MKSATSCRSVLIISNPTILVDFIDGQILPTTITQLETEHCLSLGAALGRFPLREDFYILRNDENLFIFDELQVLEALLRHLYAD